MEQDSYTGGIKKRKVYQWGRWFQVSHRIEIHIYSRCSNNIKPVLLFPLWCHSVNHGYSLVECKTLLWTVLICVILQKHYTLMQRMLGCPSPSSFLSYQAENATRKVGWQVNAMCIWKDRNSSWTLLLEDWIWAMGFILLQSTFLLIH